MRLLSSFLALLPAAAMVLSSVSAAPTAPKKNKIVPGKDFDRIVIVVFENQDYEDAAADPYYSTLAERHDGNYYYCAQCHRLILSLFSIRHPTYQLLWLDPSLATQLCKLTSSSWYMYNGASALMLVTHMMIK